MSETPHVPPAGTTPPPASAPDATPAPDRVKPAAIAAGVASLALVGGIVAVNLGARAGGDAADGRSSPQAPAAGSSSGAGPTTAAASTTSPSPGGGPTTAAPGAPETTPSSESGTTLIGSWTGKVDGGGDPVNARITLGGDPGAVTGQLLFADPDSGDWVPAGDVTGTLTGSALQVQTDTQVVLALTMDGDALSGTGTLASTDHPFPITVSLTRD